MAACRVNAADMAMASCHAWSWMIALSGTVTSAVPTANTSTLGLRPNRSDSAPKTGSIAMNTRLATTPAHSAELGSMCLTVIA
jgi:hypothetical protein